MKHRGEKSLKEMNRTLVSGTTASWNWNWSPEYTWNWSPSKRGERGGRKYI